MTNELVSDKHVRIGEMGGRSFGCKSASLSPIENGGNSMAFCQTEKLGALAEHGRISINEKRAGLPFGKVRKGRIDLAFRRHVQRLNLQSDSASRPLATLPTGSWHSD